MDIIKELSDNQTILLLMPGIEYNKIVLETIKTLSDKRVCYVTLNKTYGALKELFKKNKIKTDNILFVDAITRSLKEAKDIPKECYFVSPTSISDAFAALHTIIQQEYDYPVFDSLTNLFSYKETEGVEDLIFVLLNKIRETKTKAVFYALNEQEKFIPRCCMYVEKTIVIEK